MDHIGFRAASVASSLSSFGHRLIPVMAQYPSQLSTRSPPLGVHSDLEISCVSNGLKPRTIPPPPSQPNPTQHFASCLGSLEPPPNVSLPLNLVCIRFYSCIYSAPLSSQSIMVMSHFAPPPPAPPELSRASQSFRPPIHAILTHSSRAGQIPLG